ncbi:MAG TPA: fused MFS/spermidine synthase [Verrucomicrobiae bacterium]|nr:fused MFS/spermidine synthase [Verrucomicrobiae bacterium]
MIVLLLFFCSGATALIYEVLWSKYLTLLLGSTVQAQTVVLAVFMGGLALGNRLLGKVADRTSTPLELYGRLEIGIGVYAVLFHGLYQNADALFVLVGRGHLEDRWFLLGIKSLLSVALLLGPTVMMGGTLPLLAAWLQRRSAEAGRWSARFYSVNSLGAVFGAWLAGFYLVQALGMVSSLQMTALANVVIGLVAVVLSRKQDTPVPLATKPAAAKPASASPPSIFASGCALVALTGAVSMGLEVLASRSLGLIFGASLQSFAIVLMAFILGIGLGSSVIASARWKNIPEGVASIGLLLAGATMIGLLVLGIVNWAGFYVEVKTGLAASEMGYRFNEIITAGMAIVVLGLPAGLLGAVLPLWIRHLEAGGQALGGQVGRLLTWNTVGAVVGSLVTGFVLMPHAGLRASFFILVTILCLGALATAWARGERGLAGLAAVVAVVFLAAGPVTGAGWRDIFSSGIFRIRSNTIKFAEYRKAREKAELLFYEDAPDATVSVEKDHGFVNPGQITLRVNGKPDATTYGDLSTQYLLAHLPMLAKPDAKQVFVLGFGSGATAGALVGHPIDGLTIAENCEPVLRAGKFFAGLNRNILANPLAKVYMEDARTVLKLSPRQFDVIISEPSNPWMIGVGSVFSREFYQLAASRLTEGGVMAQWFHMYEMNDGIVTLVLRTFNQVFPNMEVWDSQLGDVILLGSQKPWESGPEVFKKVFERAVPRQDLERIGLKTPESVWARQLASQRTAFAIAGTGPTQSDAFPVLEYDAPRAFFIGSTASVFALFDERTWQSELAPVEKRRVLGGLGDEQVKSVFGQYYSMNNDLVVYFRSRVLAGLGKQDPGARGDAPAMPSIFRPNDPEALKLVIPKDADEDQRQLLTAEHEVLTATPDWPAAADRVAAIIKGVKPEPADAKPRAWRPAHFAWSVARLCIARGDLTRAGRVLVAGLEKEPGAYQLHYLGHILQNENNRQTIANAAQEALTRTRTSVPEKAK